MTKNKLIVLTIALMILLITCFIHLRSSIGSSGNSVETLIFGKRNVFDFGDQGGGTKYQHVFYLRNETDIQLTIDKTITSCHCTVASQLPSSIPPHETVPFTVSVDLPAAGGAFMQNLAILFSNHKSLHLDIEGNVIQEYPEVVDFSNVKRGDPVEKKIKLHILEKKKIEIENVNKDEKYFAIGEIRDPADPSSLELRIQLLASAPYGGFSKSLTFVTNNSSGGQCDINLRGRIQRPIEIVTNQLTFGPLALKEQACKNLELFSPYGRPFKITTIVINPPDYFKCDLTAVNYSGNRAKIPCIASGGFQSQISKAVVSVTAEIEGKREEVTFNVYAEKK